ncbi:MAG: hypothetical protein J6K58_09715 [Lachnospiraceae bacterium]|nr:hypothetical protein [Lachnospiraceae bacterium]
MSSLLEMRERLRNFYSKHEVYLVPLFKFLLALISLLCINGNIGFMDKLSGNIIIVLVVSLMCSFLPMNFIMIISAGFVCGHLYAVSLECAVVAIALFLLMFILYFRFSPKDTIVVLLLPLCFALKIPYVVPIAVGLLCTPISVVSVTCGTIVYYLILYIKTNSQTISTLEADEAVAKFRYVIDGILGNKEMMITIVAFAAIVILVYFIRRLSVDHAWTIAMSVGAVVGVVILLIGDLTYDTHISIGFLILGMVISLLLAKVLQFFAFNVDYSRTEYVQFEDDEYYYYVKAVPKNSVAQAQVKVKKITSVL